MNKSKIQLISAMTIFGTIGIFRKYIPLASSILALERGIIGTLFLIVVLLFRKEKLSKDELKKYGLILLISGACIGFNWIFLFEAYNYTTVATATLCYYMAPIFVMIISPFLNKEKYTKKSLLCILVALIGMVLVSGVLNSQQQGTNNTLGIIYGLLAALLYGTVVLLNQKLKELSAYLKTMLQLLFASLTLLPYVLLTQTITFDYSFQTTILVLCVGIIHTGATYTMYFGSMKNLEVNTIALFSYIDPIVAIILSALFLHEPMGLLEIIGAICILGSTLYNELS